MRKYLRSTLKWGAIILIVFGAFFLFVSVYVGGQEEVYGNVVSYPDYIRFMRNMSIGYISIGSVLGICYVILFIYLRRWR